MANVEEVAMACFKVLPKHLP